VYSRDVLMGLAFRAANRGAYEGLADDMRKAMDAYAHELAEKIRNDEGPLGRGLIIGPFWGDDRDREYAADLIDPEASNG
jgi:hypothetical protein